ncbi:MAG: hypothetical protein AAGA91_09560 [Pseudomonadota bacterium]
MRRDYNDNMPITEMAIVDTFTRLIFGDEEDFGLPEMHIISGFREVDVNVMHDTPVEMGKYLRNLGVREMIHLVSRLREHLAREDSGEWLTAEGGRSAGPVARRR